MSTTNIMQADEMAEQELASMAMEQPAMPTEEEIAQEIEQRRAARRAAMDSIGQTLAARLQEAITFRSQFEGEWERDIAQFEFGDPNRSSTTDTKQYAGGSEDDHNAATDNITRPAVVTYAARLGDMLFPTNDRNWDVDITPDPELPPEVMANIEESVMLFVQEGKLSEENAPAMVDSLKSAIARKRMAKMRTLIDDQLSECKYSAAGRQAIFDACRIGHGVIKGPFAKTRSRRRYVAEQGFRAEIIEDITSPVVSRRDPWNVFPMPCRSIKDCPGVFELHELSAKKLAELRNQPGFSAEQVGRVLREKPSWAGFNVSLVGRRRLNGISAVRQDELYPVVEYDGDMPVDALLVFLDQLLFESKISDEQRAEIIAEVEASNAVHLNCNVWMCNGVVMKFAVNPIDHCSQMYKFFVFEDREDGPFGRSVCSLLRDPQQNVRMLWSAILLNSMMSAGVQIGVIKGALVPAGPNAQAADLRFTKPRVWAFNDDVQDVNRAMQVFAIPNVVSALMPVYQQARANGNDQAMLPAIAQGEPTMNVQTSSGLAMMMNAANVVQRRLAARWDDEITDPVITDMYEWNMKYGPEDAKGDYLVRPRASSHLLIKDIQAQHFLTALQIFQSNPMLQPRMKDAAWAEEALRIMDLDFHRFLLSEEEYEAKQAEMAKQQGQQQDPESIKAMAAQMSAEARMLDAQSKMEAVKLDAQQAQVNFEDRIAYRESRERVAALQYQAKLVGIEKEERIAAERLRAEIEKEVERNAVQTRIAGMRAAEKAQELQFKREKVQTEIAVERETPGPRLA